MVAIDPATLYLALASLLGGPQVSTDFGQLSLRTLLESLLDENARRRLRNRDLSLDVLFERYDAEVLSLTQHNAAEIRWCRQLLAKFKDSLAGERPSPEGGRRFLARYSHRKPATIHHYANIVKGFLSWYGDPLTMKFKVPRRLPPYIPDSSVSQVRDGISKRRTKTNIARDTLLINTAYGAGLRRAELCALTTNDLHLDKGYLIIRSGKGGKDRIVHPREWLIPMLREYAGSLPTGTRLFPISLKRVNAILKEASERAGVKVRPHDLRHGFATRLAEQRVFPTLIQQELGHADLSTTQLYMGFADNAVAEAVREADQRASS